MYIATEFILKDNHGVFERKSRVCLEAQQKGYHNSRDSMEDICYDDNGWEM